MPLSSGLPELVASQEPLARFLTSSSHYNSSVVKPPAFLPNPNDGKTSVFRHDAEPRDALEAMGRNEVAEDRSLHGAAIITAAEVRAAKLEVTAAEPLPLHADIEGWPWMQGDREFGKAESKEKALLLAQKAQLLKFLDKPNHHRLQDGRCFSVFDKTESRSDY
jgi:hypothetical protein